MFRFLHMADVHLDTPFRGIGQWWPQVADALSQATAASFRRLMDCAIDEAVDFVVVAGDLYDSRDHSVRARLEAIRQFERLNAHNIPVYLAHGNHDPFEGSQMRWPSNVTVFPAGAVGAFTVMRGTEPIAEIQGLSYPESAVRENWVPAFQRREPGRFGIAVLHTNVDGQPGHDNYAPARLGDMRAQGFDYWALGHVHTRSVLSQSPWIVYPGNTQGRHINEPGMKGAYLVTVDERHQVSLTFVPSCRVIWETIEIDGRDLADEGDLMRQIDRALARREWPLPAIVRIHVADAAPRLQQDLADMEGQRAFLEQWMPDLESPSWVMLADVSFGGTPPERFQGSDDFWGEVERQMADVGSDAASLEALFRPLVGRPGLKWLKDTLLDPATRERALAVYQRWTEGQEARDGD